MGLRQVIRRLKGMEADGVAGAHIVIDEADVWVYVLAKLVSNA